MNEFKFDIYGLNSSEVETIEMIRGQRHLFLCFDFILWRQNGKEWNA